MTLRPAWDLKVTGKTATLILVTCLDPLFPHATSCILLDLLLGYGEVCYQGFGTVYLIFLCLGLDWDEYSTSDVKSKAPLQMQGR